MRHPAPAPTLSRLSPDSAVPRPQPARRWPAPLVRITPAIVPLTLGALVLALYGDALGYAFMYDDGIDLARGEHRSVWSLLTSGEGAYYYRPLPFLVWKALHALLGRYDFFWFHLPPLLLHALNAWLVYGLARALRLGAGPALLAASLFVIFPLHYQVVPWAGALFHPLVTALMLGALLAYRRFRLGGRLGWLAGSLVCAVLALFTQEYAIVLGVLVAGLEVWLWRAGEIARPRPYALLYFALGGAFALWWLSVPKWSRQFALDPESLGRNTLMVLQAVFWPLTMAWRWAPSSLLPHPEAAIAVGSGLALAGAGALYWRGRALHIPVVALGWVAIAVLPFWATLSYLYVEDGARLYYLASIGIALGWSGLATLVAQAGMGRRVGQALLAGVLVYAAWQSLDFLAERRAMYAAGSALLHQAGAIAAAAPADARLVFVNLPAWQAPVTPAFPLGNTGVTFVPEYVALGQALYVNGGAVAQLESLATDALPGGWPSHYGPHAQPWTSLPEIEAAAAGAAAAYVTRFGPQRLALEPLPRPAVLGGQPPAPPWASPRSAITMATHTHVTLPSQSRTWLQWRGLKGTGVRVPWPIPSRAGAAP
jgi:hypothetical protein